MVPSSDFIKKIPKAELHVHLEGTVLPATWKRLVQKHDIQELYSVVEKVDDRYIYKTFNEFLMVFKDILLSFRSAEDFYEITKDYLAGAVKQNIRYCEVMMTPWFVLPQGIEYDDMMWEIDRAANEIEALHDIEMRLILDGPRQFRKEVVKEVFDMAVNDKTGRVIGVGLGGDEENHPAHGYVEEFDYARSHGLKTIAHAGETAGEKSMLETIQHLKVSRIGHCLGIPESSELERLIFENNVTLDLNPWSNVRTNVIGSIEEHPMKIYLDRGYPITLNSDDPGVFGNSQLKEFQTIVDIHKIDKTQLGSISKNAVIGSFMDQAKKTRLLDEIDQFIKDND